MSPGADGVAEAQAFFGAHAALMAHGALPSMSLPELFDLSSVLLDLHERIMAEVRKRLATPLQ